MKPYVVANSCYDRVTIQDYRPQVRAKGFIIRTQGFRAKTDSVVLNNNRSFFQQLANSGVKLEKPEGTYGLFINVAEFYFQSGIEGHFFHCQLDYWWEKDGRYVFMESKDTSITFAYGQTTYDHLITRGKYLLLGIVAERLKICPEFTLAGGISQEDVNAYRNRLEHDVAAINLSEYPRGLYADWYEFLVKRPLITDFKVKGYYDSVYTNAEPPQLIDTRNITVRHDGNLTLFKSDKLFERMEKVNGAFYSRRSVMLKASTAGFPLITGIAGDMMSAAVQLKTPYLYRTKFCPINRKFYPISIIKK